MAKLELYLPVKPLSINQPFGGNAPYYARFKDAYGNPEKGHNGIDFMASHGEPVYAPCDGIAQYLKDEHGGEGVYIHTQVTNDDGTVSHYNIIHWHLIGDTDPLFRAPIPMNGVQTQVKVGTLIGFADNTGAPFESSGDHLHFGLIPSDPAGNALYPANGFNGCIDAWPYFNGKFAVDQIPAAPLSAQDAATVEQGIKVASQALKNPTLIAGAIALLKNLASFLSGKK